MKILLYHWKAYSTRFLQEHLKRLGFEVGNWFDNGVIEETAEAMQKLEEELKKGYDAVISYNYFRTIAIACHGRGTPYFAWTQDAPLLALFDNSTYYDTNFFFCFDYEQYEGMKKRGIKKAFYCPLATDVETMDKVVGTCGKKDYSKYYAKSSFVGSLYSERDMLSRLEGLPDYIKGYFDGIIETQLLLPDVRFSQTQVPVDVMQMIRSILVFTQTEESKVCYEELIDNLIDRQVTVLERRRMIDLLSKKVDFKLYTTSDTSRYPDVNNMGPVDYYTEMPKVFFCSDVNMNVTLRSIRSGIPLRILDVIASNGFLLTNAQPELFWFFEEGESIATFRSLEEMSDKLDYYLRHDEERKKIIQKGRRIIEKQFDFSGRLPEMFKMAGF